MFRWNRLPTRSRGRNRRRSAFLGWWRTFDRALFKPHLFFPSIPYEGGHRPPLRFVAFFYIQFFAVIAVSMPFYLIRTGRADRAWHGVVMSLALALLVCGVMIALLYVFTAIDHLFLRLLGGKGSFEATLRVVAYSYPTVIVRSFPVIGKFLHPVHSLICLTFGFAAAHWISKTRAFMAGLFGAALVFGLVFTGGLVFTLLLPSLKKLFGWIG